jgi:hypothetical protein
MVIAPGISFCIYLVKPRRGCGKQDSVRSERRHCCWLRAEILCADRSKAPSIYELHSTVCFPNPFGGKRTAARVCVFGLTRARPVTDSIFMSIIYWAALASSGSAISYPFIFTSSELMSANIISECCKIWRNVLLRQDNTCPSEIRVFPVYAMKMAILTKCPEFIVSSANTE